eukprot:EG_transcript_31275
MGCCCSDSDEDKKKSGEFTDLQDEAERARAGEQTSAATGPGPPSSGKLGRYETAAAAAPAPPDRMAVTQELEAIPDVEAPPDPVWKPKAHRSNIVEARRPKAAADTSDRRASGSPPSETSPITTAANAKEAEEPVAPEPNQPALEKTPDLDDHTASNG